MKITGRLKVTWLGQELSVELWHSPDSAEAVSDAAVKARGAQDILLGTATCPLRALLQSPQVCLIIAIRCNSVIFTTVDARVF